MYARGTISVRIAREGVGDNGVTAKDIDSLDCSADEGPPVGKVEYVEILSKKLQ